MKLATFLAAGLLAASGSFAAPLPEDPVPETQTPAVQRLSVPRVFELLRQNTPPDEIVALIGQHGGDFDLTIEDVVRLREAGATPELIRLMAAGGDSGEVVEEQRMAPVVEPGPDALTADQVLELHKKGVPAYDIASRVASKGMAAPPDLSALLEYRAQGVPDIILRAMAGQAPPAPAPTQVAAKPALPPPAAALTTLDVIQMLEQKEKPDSITQEIGRRGMQAAPTLDEVLALRKAGATEAILAAINDASPQEQAAEGEAGSDVEQTRTAEGIDAADESGSDIDQDEFLDTKLPPAGQDNLWVTSVPPGARVYVSPSRTRLADATRHDYLSGRTPLLLPLPPGDYRVIVQKDAGGFESSLVPAWRTLHDSPGSRTLLDNADLTFQPEDCCLPGTVTGAVEIRPVSSELPRGIIGDLFEGLPPFLFDGESTQMLRVRNGRITHSMKAYLVRKNAGEPRTLVSTFIPSEGNPLDMEHVPGLPPGSPFDAWVDDAALSFLTDATGQSALAAALGVEVDHLDDAVAMLRKAGKAILHQPVEGGFRLLSISLDEAGRIRLKDQIVRPVDPFAAPAAAATTKSGKPKKKKTQAPPPVPPLPQADREVVPGLGLPRLLVDNTSSRGLGLLLSDGEFCFVAAKSRNECVVEPGTFAARVLNGSKPAAPAPAGTLHFSYHARYTIKF